MVLNDVSDSGVVSANGRLLQWIDGEKVLELTGMIFRESNKIFIDQIKMDTFFGGSTLDWAPATDQYAYFDSFVVSEIDPL